VTAATPDIPFGWMRPVGKWSSATQLLHRRDRDSSRQFGAVQLSEKAQCLIILPWLFFVRVSPGAPGLPEHLAADHMDRHVGAAVAPEVGVAL